MSLTCKHQVRTTLQRVTASFLRAAIYGLFAISISIEHFILARTASQSISLRDVSSTSSTDKEYNIWRSQVTPEKRASSSTIPSPVDGARAAVYSRNHPYSRALSSNSSRVLLFGGLDLERKSRGTWTYTPSDNSWFHFQLDKEPVDRSYHTLTSLCQNYVVLFGGVPTYPGIWTSDLNTGKYQRPMGDTWLFNGVDEIWEQLSPTQKNYKHYPLPRYLHTVAALNNENSPCLCKQSAMMYGGALAWMEDGGMFASRELWELRCVRQRSLNVSFQWLLHKILRGQLWPPLSILHFATHADESQTVMLLWSCSALQYTAGICDDYSSLNHTWQYNITSNTWSYLDMQEPKKIDSDQMIWQPYSTVTFYPQRNSAIQISNGQIFILNLDERSWEFSNRTMEVKHRRSVFTSAAVYVDCSVLIFAPVELERDYVSMAVWEFRHDETSNDWLLSLIEVPVGHERPPPNVVGIWNRIGDDLVVSFTSDQDAYLEELNFVIHLNFQNTGLFFESIFPIWMYYILLDKMRSLPNSLEFRRQTVFPIAYHVVFQMDLHTMTWKRYTMNLPPNVIMNGAASANWNDELLVVYGSLGKFERTGVHATWQNMYTSDVWVYYVQRKQWFKVTTSGDAPRGRVHSTFVYLGNNSFLLHGGASMGLSTYDFKENVTNAMQWISAVLNVSELVNVLEPANDLWLLILSDCGELCSQTGITGTWTEITAMYSSTETNPKGLMGHTAVAVDSKMFVLGGMTITKFQRIVCNEQFLKYDIKSKTWAQVNNGNGGLSTYLSPKMCRIPATAIYSRVVISLETPNYKNHEKLLSYVPNLARWVDHNISLPSPACSFFQWRYRVLIVCQKRTNSMSTDEFSEMHQVTPSVPQMVISMLKLGCKPGQSCENWSTDVCRPCAIGYFAAESGTKSCTKCPIGLTTDITGVNSSEGCLCSRHHCKHGVCLVVDREGLTGAVCKCDFGYTGERCEFPTLLIITLTITGLLMVIGLMVLLIQKIVKYRKQKRARDGQLDDMHRAWTINSAEVRLLHRLDLRSPGSYGDVYKARYRDIDVAVKKLKVVLRDDARVEREFEREIQVMKSLRHPNIVLFIGAGKYYDEENCPFLVLEFMKGGTLSSFLRNQNRQLRVAQQLSFCLDAARGLEFLHDLSPPRVHRDIKSSNLLLSERLVVKVSDFGSARLVKRRGEMQNVVQSRAARFHAAEEASKPLLSPDVDLSRNVGAVLWRAPEVFLAQSYGTPIDVYSFGIVMWEMATRELPYNDHTFQWIQDVADAVCSGERPTVPTIVPQDYKELMTDCWLGNPTDRPNFTQVVHRLERIQECRNDGTEP